MQHNANTRVLAFDPGFERLGAAVIEKKMGQEILLHSECIHTSSKDLFSERLLTLGTAVEALIVQFQPNYMSLEDLYFAKNTKTAMKVAEVRGMLIYLAAKHSLTLFEYTPLQIKVAITGYGQSDKKAVTHMVSRLLTLPARARLDDEIDAIAIGLTCLASIRTVL